MAAMRSKITAKQKSARRRNIAIARQSKKKSAKKLGMTQGDLASIPGTKEHLSKNYTKMLRSKLPDYNKPWKPTKSRKKRKF